MKRYKVRAPWRAMCGLGCAIGIASLAIAEPMSKPPQDGASDSASNSDVAGTTGARARPAIPVPPVSGGGDEGGIAGNLLWDNGPLNTGEDMSATCGVPGSTRSTLQNTTPQCLNILGFGMTTFRALDDFTLTQCSEIDSVTVFAYLTNATTPTITGATVNLHSGRPWSTTSNIIATSSTLLASEPPSLTTIFRATPTSTTPCVRQIQQAVIDTSSWPALPPGTYWLSWNVVGAAFCPPVTILGMQGKPGANGGQSSSAIGATPSTWNGLFDAGVAGCVPSPATVPQDWPFILRGTTASCSTCPADANGNGVVDVDDLIAVILQWGCTGASCTADVDDNGVVDVDDLIAVILNWGCTGGSPPSVSTGACCTGSSCAVQTYGACLAAGGIYFGDGTTCASANNCAPPVNDECATASTATIGSVTFNTSLATNSQPPVAFPGCAEFSRDVWFTFQSVAGEQYTIDTVTSPIASDTVLLIYNTTDCPNLAPGAVWACNDDANTTTLLSSITTSGNGNTWLIRVGTFVTNAGDTADGAPITLRITSP